MQVNPERNSVGHRARYGDMLSLLLLWAAVCLLFWNTLHAGEFWWTDESRHAMNGVFFLDLWRDMPWRAPYDYALQYFAQYPAVALNWYPPFFPVVEAGFFAVFGITEFSARLTILGFALTGVTAWYAWVRPIWGRATAILSCLLYLSAPGVIAWTRSVMLEVPAVAMIIVSVLAFDRYLDHPSFRRAGLAGLTLGCTLLLKQTTAFILPALLAYALLTGRRRLLWRRQAILAYVMIGTVAVVLTLHALKFGLVPVDSLVKLFSSDSSQLFSFERWWQFWSILWQVCGAPLGIAMLAGAALWLQTRSTRQDSLIFLWFGASYLFTTMIIGGQPGNVPRYTMYALPVLALLACRPLSRPVTKDGNMQRVALVLLSALAAWNVYSAWDQPHPYVAGYEQAAKFVMQQDDTGLILFAGKHDGDFIFHLRALDPAKEKAVLRADKILVSMAVHKSFGTVSYVRSTEDVIGLIDRFGIGIIVIESRDVVDLPEFKLLAKALEDPRFKIVKEMPLVTNVPEFSNLSVQIYRNLEKKKQTGDLVIPLPHMGMEIKLKPRGNVSSKVR